MQRDIDDYAKQYELLPFEAIQASYRRRVLVARIDHHRPSHLLEIGCGRLPLFVDLPGVRSTVIEPSLAFAQNARLLSVGREDVMIVNGYVENYAKDAPNQAYGFDMIVLSCLLHEVDDPDSLLAAVRHLCMSDTVVHINVPNANSMHRLLALAMGIIASTDSLSETQRVMQQRLVYDVHKLRADICKAGFEILDEGSLFVKPFTHAQMQTLVDVGFMSTTMLDGLSQLANIIPGLGSEIWIEARRRSELKGA